MQTKKFAVVGTIVIFSLFIAGCGVVQEKVSNITTPTVPLSQMRSQENIGKTVKVVSLVGVNTVEARNPVTSDGLPLKSFYLIDDDITAKTNEVYKQTGKVYYPPQRIQLITGFSPKTQIIPGRQPANAQIKTDSGEAVLGSEKLAFTGKIVPVTSTLDGSTNVCQLENVSISKP